MTRRASIRSALAVCAGALVVTGCAAAPGQPTSGTGAADRSATPSDQRPAVVDRSSAARRPAKPGTLTDPATGLGSRPPPWLGTRELPRVRTGYGEVRPTPPALRNRRFTLPDTVPMLDGEGYAAKVVAPAPRRVIARSTWEPGCPVSRDDLAWVRLTFWGFDAERHTGELLVHRTVARDVVKVFGVLYRQRFPQEQVVIVASYDPDAPPTGDGNGTGAFVCRPSTGATYFSQHAYGLAVDVNTFQNPYVKGEVLLPELASAYLRRDRVRPGMIVRSGPVVEAFARIGWKWGGDWQQSLDLHHFSRNGR